MVTISMSCIYIGLCLLAYLMNMLYGWEMIFTALLLLPIYAYAKSNKRVMNTFICIQTIALFARYAVSTVVGVKFTNIVKPISMDDTLIKQFSGITTIVGWFIWLALTGGIVYVTAKSCSAQCKTIKELENSKSIIHAINLFSVTTVIVIISVVVAGQAYALNDYYWNLLVFVLVAIMIAIAVYAMQINIIRERKEQIILAEKDDLVMIDLDDKSEEIEKGIKENGTELAKKVLDLDESEKESPIVTLEKESDKVE